MRALCGRLAAALRAWDFIEKRLIDRARVFLRRAGTVILAVATYLWREIVWLSVIAFVAAGVYLSDVRPRVREFKKNNNTHAGPYGPW